MTNITTNLKSNHTIDIEQFLVTSTDIEGLDKFKNKYGKNCSSVSYGTRTSCRHAIDVLQDIIAFLKDLTPLTVDLINLHIKTLICMMSMDIIVTGKNDKAKSDTLPTFFADLPTDFFDIIRHVKFAPVNPYTEFAFSPTDDALELLSNHLHAEMRWIATIIETTSDRTVFLPESYRPFVEQFNQY